MKKSFFGFALTLVMAFGIASCGKSGGGGGGGIGTSLLTSGNLDQYGQQYANDLNTWIQGTETISQPGHCGSFNVVRSNTSGNTTNNNCQQGQWLGFINYSYCSGSGSGNQGTAQPAVLTTVNCSATVRSAYPSIQNILATGTIVQAQKVSQSAFKVVMQRSNSSFVTYIIDTALPAAFQPMISHDSATGVQSTVTNIQLAY